MKILIYDNGVPFQLGTPYFSPLGGSETSILLLSKGLSDLGHKVLLLNNCNYQETVDNITVLPNTSFKDVVNSADVVIFNRTVFEEYMFDKPTFYFAHDAYDQPIVNWLRKKSNVELFKAIICVSEWQRNTFHRYFGIEDYNKMEILGNPVDLKLYSGWIERNENRLIYASVPYKGLDLIPDLFNDIQIKSKNKDLELQVFSSMSLWSKTGTGNENEAYYDTYSKLSRMEGVFVNDIISMKQLAWQLQKSSICLHPNIYHETFGMILTQAQAAGCVPVTTNKGAVNELIENEKTGIVIDHANIENINCYNKYVDKVCELLENDISQMRNNCTSHVRKWDYVNVAKKCIDILERNL